MYIQKNKMVTPTEETYTGLQLAYEFFNQRLFDNRLPPCLITLQRKNRTYGYFSGNRWENKEGQITDEIALNPLHFANRSDRKILGTLVHEMVHLWQHHFGKPSRSGYHNKEWAKKMESIGLIPSDTGEEGGQKTGQRVSHYIQEDGFFARACDDLLTENFAISWSDRSNSQNKARTTKSQKSGIRIKYSCPACGLNAWAKSEVSLICGECSTFLEPN